MKFIAFSIFTVLVAVSYVAAKDGFVSIYNSGGYVAKFNVQYQLSGEKHEESSGDFTLGVTKTIKIPDGASDIYLSVMEYWFPGQLSTIFTAIFDIPLQKCYKIWGTTLNPQHGSMYCY